MKNLLVLSLIFSAFFLINSCDLEEIPDGNNPGEDPTACFTFSVLDDPCASNCQVQFTDCSQNASSYAWDFGDGNNSTDQNPLHEYASNGTYTVTLVATNASGTDQTSETLTITSPGEPPVACFTFQVLETGPCESNCRVQFTNCSQNATSYTWDFGNGQSSTDINPLHTFTSPGTFAVQLTSSNAIGSDNSTLDVFIDGVDHIYVAGYEEINPSGGDIVKYWKNGEAVGLTSGNYSADSYSVFVQDDDVYVSGYERISDTQSNATYWRNGVPNVLVENGEGDPLTQLSSIFVDGDDVYVCGSDIFWIVFSNARYWKNNVLYELTDGTNVSMAQDIFVENGDVYVAGAGSNNDGEYVARYWKNGVAYDLNTQYIGFALGIYVVGDDVHVAGSTQDSEGGQTAKYWLNGWQTDLSPVNGSLATSVFVSGGDVYVSGYQPNASGGYTAKYWKNGVENNLPSGENTSYANSIFVVGDDVYVAGYDQDDDYNYIAKYWLNNEEFILSDPVNDAQANSIFVVER